MDIKIPVKRTLVTRCVLRGPVAWGLTHSVQRGRSERPTVRHPVARGRYVLVDESTARDSGTDPLGGLRAAPSIPNIRLGRIEMTGRIGRGAAYIRGHPSVPRRTRSCWSPAAPAATAASMTRRRCQQDRSCSSGPASRTGGPAAGAKPGTSLLRLQRAGVRPGGASRRPSVTQPESPRSPTPLGWPHTWSGSGSPRHRRPLHRPGRRGSRPPS